MRRPSSHFVNKITVTALLRNLILFKALGTTMEYFYKNETCCEIFIFSNKDT